MNASAPPESPADVEAAVRRWIERVVIGLNLCPFSARPYRSGRLRLCVSDSRDVASLLTELHAELQRLDDTPPAVLETTVIAIPYQLADFLDYNDVLDQVDALLAHFGWAGVYQVASFHPDYRFEGTAPDDPGNYTNRSPVPLLHLLREDGVEAAIDGHPGVERIPDDNIRRLGALSAAELQALFFDGERGR